MTQRASSSGCVAVGSKRRSRRRRAPEMRGTGRTSPEEPLSALLMDIYQLTSKILDILIPLGTTARASHDVLPWCLTFQLKLTTIGKYQQLVFRQQRSQTIGPPRIAVTVQHNPLVNDFPLIHQFLLLALFICKRTSSMSVFAASNKL